MSNNVSITMSAKDGDVQKMYQRLERKQDQLEQKLKKGGATSRKATNETKRGFDGIGGSIVKATGKLTNFMSGLTGMGVSVGAVFGAIRQEVDSINKQRETSRITTLDAAQAIRAAKLNLTDDADINSGNFEEKVQELAERTNSSVQIVSAALSSALSAKGELPNMSAFQAVENSLRLDPTDAAGSAELAGRQLDIAKQTGTTDLRSIAGLLVNLQKNARVTSIQQAGKNLVPAIGGLTETGGTTEQNAELIAAFSSFARDASGEKSKTAFLDLNARLMEYRPEKNGGKYEAKDVEGEVFTIPDEQVDKLRKAMSPLERLQTLAESPELQRAFLGEKFGEAEMKPFLQGVIRNTQGWQAALGNAQKNIQGLDVNQSKAFEAEINRLNTGKFQPILTTEQRSKSADEKFELGTQLDQRIASARDVLKTTLEKTDNSGWDYLKDSRDLGRFDAKMQTSENPEAVAAQILMQLRAEILSTQSGTETGDAAGKYVLEKAQILLDQGYSYDVRKAERESRAASEKQTGMPGPQASSRRASVNGGDGQAVSRTATASEQQVALLSGIASELKKQNRGVAFPATQNPSERLSRGNQQYG